MGHTSKDLLHLEHKDCSTSSLESTLLVCNRKGSHTEPKKLNPNERPNCSPIPKSQVLDKVKDFLGAISEANKRLQLDAKDNAQNYDIEVLTGNESEVIEMDLMLGIADLHTPDAVSAAESAIAGNQPMIPLPANCSETETEDSSDESDDGDENGDTHDDNEDGKALYPTNLKRSKTSNDNSLSESAQIKQSKKRPKIFEL